MKTTATTIIISTIISISSIALANSDKEIFLKLDTNKDGYLTQKEILSQTEMVRFTNLYSQGSFHFADINKDGLLDNEEYLANEEDIY